MTEKNADFLNEEEKKFLLQLARQSIVHYLKNREMLDIEVDNPRLKEKQGAFVTLHVNGELRGCIGYPLPYKPLYQTIIEVAVAAATEDYRFTPLSEEELDDLSIEISVLTLPRKVERPEEVVVGKHGIIISKGLHKGLLLPQVPLEYGWDLETYLNHGCLKAGLPPDEWRRGVNLEVFEAQVFSEDDYRRK
ncbi:MAG: AmmeMemoRadiSam system protein A [Candidatus Aminicenantes bacterium]|nr:AmmeMemoRadiSam system protein A [Candidatus Aminicenantes bacterium]